MVHCVVLGGYFLTHTVYAYVSLPLPRKLHFTRRLSFCLSTNKDNEKPIKYWKSSESGSESRNLLKIPQH